MQSQLLSGLNDFSAGSRELYWTDPMMQGEDVQFVQLRVGAAPDGIFGPKTHNAVMKFQNEQGLTPTGVVDEETMEVLRKVSAPGSESPGGGLATDNQSNTWIWWTIGGIAAAGIGITLAKQ